MSLSLKRETKGELIFWAATICAFALYCISAPNGLPWNSSVRVALAWAGDIAKLPTMPHPVWGYFIQVFGGKFIAVSAVAIALSAGLIGAIFNRYLGWRVGAAAALVWMFLPPIWDRAITGAHSAFWLFALVLALWLANAIFLFATRRARQVAVGEGAANTEATLAGVERREWEFKVNRTVGWVILGVSALFAVVSSVEHDYLIGEVASAYARTMLDEADGRIVVMGGIADDQMIWEAERREQGASARLLTLRGDDAYRAQLVQRVKQDWPGETNLWVAAQIGPKTFAELAVQHHPERVYLMTGVSTTLEKWCARWEMMKPYLGSTDGFIPIMRRAFAFEANTLANRLMDEGKPKEAWQLYWRIFEEVDPANAAATVNLNEMLRGGFKVDEQQQRRVVDAMARLKKHRNAVAMVRASGPVRPDDKVMAEFRAEYERRMKELETPDAKLEIPAALKSLVELSDEMIRSYNVGNLQGAGRIARVILSRREGRGFIPANAVMGAVMASDGDYVASAAFYRTAFSGAAKPPPAVYNDFADTLMHLGELAEAEIYARRGIAETPETDWILRLTLAEILKTAKKNPDEIKELLKVVYRHAPEIMRIRVKKDFRRQ